MAEQSVTFLMTFIFIVLTVGVVKTRLNELINELQDMIFRLMFLLSVIDRT